jgi:superfamily II DNA or RNA helicase
MTLYEFQKEHANYLVSILEPGRTIIDASDTGTGKTYVSAYIAKTLKLRPIVICPKSVLICWKRVFKIFDLPYLGLSNYEMIKGCKWYPFNDGDEIGKITKCDYLVKNDDGYQWSDQIDENILIIYDEAHRCKNKGTTNAKFMMSTRDLTARKLLLSATIADKPNFFSVFAYMLGFCDNIENYRLFLRNIEAGGSFTTEDYISRKKISKMEAIHKKVFPKHGGRLRISELGDIFPDNFIITDSYVMDDAIVAGIREAYESIRTVSIRAEALQKESTCVLSELIYARQKIESLKVKSMSEIALDHLENNDSVVLFVNFLDTMALLSDELSRKGVKVNLFIRGGQTMKERQAIIDRFQSDSEHIIICQIQSGGVGISLHDINGNRKRVSIISPSWSAQDLKQSIGRIHRAGSKTHCIQKLIYCYGTVEDRIKEVVKQKLDNYNLLNNGSS